MSSKNVIENEEEYEDYLNLIDELMDAEPDSDAEEELERLTNIVEAYEAIHHPMGTLGVDFSDLDLSELLQVAP